jgi:hypothetical protein
MKIRISDKRLHVSRVNIEFADDGDMYDVHNLKLQIHCSSPCTIESSIPLTKPEMEKLGEALILIQQRLNTAVEVPEDALQD